MKRIVAIALLTLAALVAGIDAPAQEHTLKARIPFVFAVGDQVLPAGTYTITSPSSGLMLVRSADLRHSAITTAGHGNMEPKAGSKLIFKRYDDQYFLHQVLCQTSATMNFDLPTSKLEKRVRLNEATSARGEVALLVVK